VRIRAAAEAAGKGSTEEAEGELKGAGATKVVDLNPKAVTTEELYGCISMATRWGCLQ
jgi:hypothetical protein